MGIDQSFTKNVYVVFPQNNDLQFLLENAVSNW